MYLLLLLLLLRVLLLLPPRPPGPPAAVRGAEALRRQKHEKHQCDEAGHDEFNENYISLSVSSVSLLFFVYLFICLFILIVCHLTQNE